MQQFQICTFSSCWQHVFMSSQCISWGKRSKRQYYADHNLITTKKESLVMTVKYMYSPKWTEGCNVVYNHIVRIKWRSSTNIGFFLNKIQIFLKISLTMARHIILKFNILFISLLIEYFYDSSKKIPLLCPYPWNSINRTLTYLRPFLIRN